MTPEFNNLLLLHLSLKHNPSQAQTPVINDSQIYDFWSGPPPDSSPQTKDPPCPSLLHPPRLPLLVKTRSSFFLGGEGRETFTNRNFSYTGLSGIYLLLVSLQQVLM